MSGPLGDPVRIGVVLPSANCVLEPDFSTMMPRGVTAHFSRFTLYRLTQGDLDSSLELLDDSARLLMDAGVRVVGLGCTALSFYGGAGHDTAIIRRLEKIVGVPVTTTSTAVVRALRALRAQKVSVVTPYPSWINERERSFLEAAGFEVTAIAGLGKEMASDIAQVPPEEIAAFARETFRDTSDCLFISCTNFRGASVIQLLETEIRRPVVTSNQATLWMMLGLARADQAVAGFGRLFSLPLESQ